MTQTDEELLGFLLGQSLKRHIRFRQLLHSFQFTRTEQRTEQSVKSFLFLMILGKKCCEYVILILVYDSYF